MEHSKRDQSMPDGLIVAIALNSPSPFKIVTVRMPEYREQPQMHLAGLLSRSMNTIVSI